MTLLLCTEVHGLAIGSYVPSPDDDPVISPVIGSLMAVNKTFTGNNMAGAHLSVNRSLTAELKPTGPKCPISLTTAIVLPNKLIRAVLDN